MACLIIIPRPRCCRCTTDATHELVGRDGRKHGQFCEAHGRRGAARMIVGLDLSLTSTGICALPMEAWDCEPSKCRVETVKYSRTPHDDEERAARLTLVARRTLAVACELAAGQPITCWGIESLPTHGAFATAPLGELHGVIRFLLLEAGQRLVTVPQSSARKLLLGKLPRKDAKEIVRQTVVSFAGCGSWRPDEADAFVVANWLASECGGVALAA